MQCTPYQRIRRLHGHNNAALAWESGAIIDYILRVYDTFYKLHLNPNASEQDKVDFDKWVYFLVSTLAPMTGQCNWFRHYHATKNEDALKRYQEQAYRAYSVLEGQLKKSGGDTILGGRFSAVDAHFYPWVDEWEFAGLSLEEYPLVKAWYEKTKKMEWVQKAYAKVRSGEKA